MTNEQVMQLMTDLGLHEGGLENWVHDNAWVTVINKAIEIEREECAKVCEDMIASVITKPMPLRDIVAAIRARSEK